MILFSDFDGVLFDTMREVYLINRFCYRGIDLFEEIDEENYKLYSKYKYLVYNIWMFHYYNPLIFENIPEKDIVSKFNYLIQKRDIQKEEQFCYEFLLKRRELINNNFEFWKNLEVPYEFFYKIKELYEKENFPLVIVSKKNKKSIMERFESYNFKLDEDKIFAREVLDNYNNKGEFIEEYMRKTGFNEAIFVDDNINNLNTANNPNIKTILALWGNCEPNSTGYSQDEAIKTIQFHLLNQDKN